MILEKCWDTDPHQCPSMATVTEFFVSQLALQTHQHIIHISQQAARDLMGQIELTEDRPFNRGGFAEIWKGEWMPNPSGVPVVVFYFVLNKCFCLSNVHNYISTGSSESL